MRTFKILERPVFREFFAVMHKILKFITPLFILDAIAEKRFYFLYKFAFDKKLKQQIIDSKFLTAEMIDDVQKRHNLKCRWGAVMTALNEQPSRDYVSEAFYYSQMLPRMNNLKFVETYTDKNLYHHFPFGYLTPDVLLRKISGRYFDKDYEPISIDKIQLILNSHQGHVVIKPAIESGSGVNIWVGPAMHAYTELSRREVMRDIVVQPRLQNHPSIAYFNESSVNTFKVMTAFDGERHVALGGHLRIGRAGSVTDNRGSGGLAVGIRDDGSMCDFALGPGFIKFDKHPDHKIIFKGNKFDRYAEITSLCCDLHHYFPHFGMIGWDATIDSDDKIRIIEINLSWHGIQVTQFSHGPLLGIHKDKIVRTYNIPNWEL
jgi:hypothetical protein